MRILSLSLSAVLMLALSACGGGDTAPGGLPPAATDSAGPPPPAATATVQGRIIFEGQAPTPSRIQMSADPFCARANPNATSEEVIVSDGGLENVMVFVSSPVEGNFPTPATEILIDQRNCQYTPRVFTAMVGQPVRVRNSDMTLHNVHTFPERNAVFNVGQAVQGREDVTVFSMEEQPIPVRCDVHRWMGAFGGAFRHPYHAVSGQGGQYEFRLAPGSYEVTAWHERYGAQRQTIEVTDGGTVDLNFTFTAG